MIVPQYVPGIVTNSQIVDTVGSKHTQLVDSQDGEVAVYGTLQVVNIKQPPPQATISITQGGDGFVSRLVRVCQIAFEQALEDQRGVAMGINFNATVELPKQTANSLLFGLLNPRIAAHRDDSRTPLTSAGLKLLYKRDDWVATIAIEMDQSNDKQLVCAVNFNLNRPTKNDVKHIREAEKLRQWFEQTVKNIVEESIDG